MAQNSGEVSIICPIKECDYVVKKAPMDARTRMAVLSEEDLRDIPNGILRHWISEHFDEMRAYTVDPWYHYMYDAAFKRASEVKIVLGMVSTFCSFCGPVRPLWTGYRDDPARVLQIPDLYMAHLVIKHMDKLELIRGIDHSKDIDELITILGEQAASAAEITAYHAALLNELTEGHEHD